MESRNLEKTHMTVNEMTSRDFYLDSKAHLKEISTYLNDAARINFFKNAILYNKHLFRERTVLEISTRIGILSLFAAKAGATKVYTVDCSNILDYTSKLIISNGYKNVIEIIKGHIEAVELPVNKVDIIISDCLGYSILYNSNIDLLLYARDRWLKPNGIMIPDKAELFVAGFENAYIKGEHFDWWANVYGFNMSTIRKWALAEPFIQNIEPEMVKTESVLVKSINFYRIKYEELNVYKTFTLYMPENGYIDGIMSYFTMSFTKSHVPTTFSTSPSAPKTNFRQMLFQFENPIKCDFIDKLHCELKMKTMKENFNNLIAHLYMRSDTDNYQNMWIKKFRLPIMDNLSQLAFQKLAYSKEMAEKEEQTAKEKIKVA